MEKVHSQNLHVDDSPCLLYKKEERNRRKKKKKKKRKKTKRKKISAWQKAVTLCTHEATDMHRGKEDEDKKKQKKNKKKLTKKKKMKKKGLQHWGFECGHPPFY